MATQMLRTKAKSPTHAIFGLDSNGDTFSYEIGAGPHWIVCGETGSGKSVYLNAIFITMMVHSHPDELKIFMVDPKLVEFAPYEGSPYCPIKPVTDMNDAYGLLIYLTMLMDERYKKLSDVGVKQISEYNDFIDKNPEEAKIKGLTKMPYIIVAIDEYADMVMQNREVEAPIIRLGQKSRAAGIHCIIATQRPSADIISPNIKANIPSRVCLKVADSVNSMIVIDEAGGEKLAGYGDSLVKVREGMTRVQGPYITNDELHKILNHLKEKYKNNPVLGEDYQNYKQILVDSEKFEWAEEYSEDTSMDERKIKPIRSRGFGRV